MRRQTIYIGISALILLIAGLLLVYAHFFGPADRYETAQEEFIVPVGESNYDIIGQLKSQGFIRSRTAFSIALQTVNKDAPVRSGGYEISASDDVWTVAGILGQPPYLVWFTFPPGWRKEQIAAKLAATFAWTPAQETEWLNVDTDPSPSFDEGVYYPDTYLIPSDQTPAQIAQRFLDRFQQVFAPYATEAQQEGIPWTEVVTMASLIEREAASTQDMPLIAGIMWNRMHLHMALQIDATLQYITGTQADWWPVPTSQDKFIKSPFNTYQNIGLPPHPIAEPSLAAINAVLHPEKTSCLYYLHDPTGQIHCSVTYAGQVANVAKYLK